MPPKKSPPENFCSMFFGNKDMEFIKIARILRDPEMVKSLPTSCIKFPIPMVTCKLSPLLPSKFFNFNKFFNNLDLNVFLRNPDALPYKWKNSPFLDRPHKYIVTGDLPINKILVFVFQVGLVKMLLINLSFWNGPNILPMKLMKK